MRWERRRLLRHALHPLHEAATVGRIEDSTHIHIAPSEEYEKHDCGDDHYGDGALHAASKCGGL